MVSFVEPQMTEEVGGTSETAEVAFGIRQCIVMMMAGSRDGILIQGLVRFVCVGRHCLKVRGWGGLWTADPRVLSWCVGR